MLCSDPMEVQLIVMFPTCNKYRQGTVSIIFHKQTMNYVVFCNLRPSFLVRLTGQVTSCYDDVAALVMHMTDMFKWQVKYNVLQPHYLKQT